MWQLPPSKCTPKPRSSPLTPRAADQVLQAIQLVARKRVGRFVDQCRDGLFHRAIEERLDHVPQSGAACMMRRYGWDIPVGKRSGLVANGSFFFKYAERCANCRISRRIG